MRLIDRLAQIIENNGLAFDSTGALSSDTLSTVKLMGEALGRLLIYVRLKNVLKSDLEAAWAEIERGKSIGRERRHVFDYLKPPEKGENGEDTDG